MNEPTPQNQPTPGTPPQQGYPGYPQQYSQQPYGYQQPKKRRVWPWVLGGVLLVMLLGMGACVAFVGGVANNIDKESKRQVTVTYEVTGSGNSVAVTYSGHDFNTAQDTGVSLPWTKQVTVDGLGKTVSLTATNGPDNNGTVTCRISANGKVLAEQTSSGPFATANCIGNAGNA